MVLVAIIVFIGLGVGFAARGNLRNFERLQVHWWGIAVVGLGLQAVPVPERFGSGLAVGLLVASYVLLIGFVWVNRRLPAAPLMLIGLLLNLTVISANHGMPVSAEAIRTVGAKGNALITGIEGTKHHLMTSGDVLRPLADVIPVPPPLGVILSIGDLFLYAGVACFVVFVMLGHFDEYRRPRARLQMYRGKHLPPRRRLPHRTRARSLAAPTSAAKSGTAR
jgi:hypothetical protein